MQAGRNADAFERLVLDEFLADDLQHLHRLVRPLDAFLAQIGQFKSFYVAANRCRSHCSPNPRCLKVKSQKSNCRSETPPWISVLPAMFGCVVKVKSRSRIAWVYFCNLTSDF